MAETLVLTRRRDRGLAAEETVAAEIAELRRAFEEHNRYEEAALRPLLADQDRWGPARVGRMLEEHVGEHQAFIACLTRDTPCTTAALAEFVEEVDAHMAAEERVFLNVAVLRDPA
jgi:hypothetical protein